MSQTASTINEHSQTTFESEPLPKGWRWVRLEEVVSPHNGYWGQDEPFQSSTEILVLGVGNITNDGAIKLDGVQRRHFSQYEQEAIALEGDLLVVKSSGSASNIRSGKVGICSPELSGRIACSNFMIRLVVNTKEAEPYLLWQVLNSGHAKKFIKLIAGSTTYPNIKWETYRNFTFPLPPLSEQKRIAATLKEQVAAVERARAATEAQLKAAKDLAAAYLREVFNSQEAQQWERKPLKDYVLSYRNGFGRRPKELEEGAIVLRLADVSSGFIDISNPRRGAMSAEEFSTYQLLPSDVLFVRVNGSSHLIGRCIPVNLNRSDLAYNDHLIRVRLHDELDPNFLKAVCDLPEVRAEIVERASTSAGQLTINQDVIASIRVPLAPVSEQQRIVSTLKERTQAASLAITAIQDQLDSINKLPAALLRQAFTGKL